MRAYHGVSERTGGGMIVNRVFARANKWTFEIPPIKELLNRYVIDGKDWVDPFAGNSKLCEYRNDMNPEREQPSKQEAEIFANFLYQTRRNLKGCVFDPPYSYRQVSEHYKECGKKASSMDTSANFTIRVKRAIAPIIRDGGYAISFGWNTNGFGKCLGFEIVEILVVAHGLTHNDTLVTVERKL
jgi:hypothetical protein